MFRASSAHLQEDTVVHMQHMVLSLSESSWWPVGTQLECELTPSVLTQADGVNSHSGCVPTGHQELS